MPLISLSEPQDLPQDKPDSPRPVVGIDLGTTNSLVGVSEGDSVRILEDENGRAVIPSAVCYASDDSVRSGFAALNYEPGRDTLVTSSKRLLGLSGSAFDEACANLGYQTSHHSDVGRIVAGQKLVSAVEVSAQILRMLWALAREYYQGEPEGCVITVPAYFGEKQRQAVRLAARLQGINVLRLLDEPTAAAIAYGLDHEDSRHILVYDLGGGTFDVSVIRLHHGVFEVLAIGGDDALGGDDFDTLVVDRLRDKLGADLDALPTVLLRRKARQIKEGLSAVSAVQADLSDIGLGQIISFSVDELEAAIAPLITRTLELTARALDDSGLRAGQLDKIILAGGATRVPALARSLAEHYDQEILDHIDPERVVVEGAALHAGQLVGNLGNRHLLLGVLPLSLGIETMGGIVEVILPRNTTLPARQVQHFTTHQNDQTGMIFHIVQGEREMSRDCRSLARFELKNLPAAPAGMLRVELSFEVDADGLLSAQAREPGSGAQINVEVRPSSGLSEAQVKQMLQDSYRHAETDHRRRLIGEQRLESEQALAALDRLLGKAVDLSDDQRQKINKQAGVLRRLLKAENYEGIQTALAEVNELSSGLVQHIFDQRYTGKTGQKR